ncbi:MAG: hypothetical protein JWN23_2294 [Rhodocyclales bacterium]|nr:hypothetical protein [Rhodocyclales bacterium]
MTSLRVTFYLLVAFNLVCIMAIAMPRLGMPAPFLGATEPERMSSQVLPEKLRVLSVGTELSSAPGVENSAPLPNMSAENAPVAESAPAPQAAAVSEVSAPVVATTDSAATSCIAFKNLTSIQAQALAQRARGTGTNLTVREEAATPSSYWVNIPPQGGKAGADRRAAELKQLGLDDFFVVQDAGDNRYAISLGLFHAQGLAERQLEALQKRGVKGATVTARENASGARVELIGAGAQIERVARDAGGEIQGAQRDTCKAG